MTDFRMNKNKPVNNSGQSVDIGMRVAQSTDTPKPSTADRIVKARPQNAQHNNGMTTSLGGAI